MANEVTDIIIVGAGTAGLTAAIYAGRAGSSILLFEQSIHGGQIINTPHVENFPGVGKVAGYEFASALYDQAMSFGAQIQYERVTDVQFDGGRFVVTTDKGSYAAKSVILATGAKPRPLGVAGEEKYVGRGISFCATCDGAFYRGKTVAVVGGGNTALEDAMVLANLAQKVYLIHRRAEFRAEKQLINRLAKYTNIQLVLDTVITELKGTARIEGIEVVNKITNATVSIALDGIFVAIGQMPDNQAFAHVVELDANGYIVAGEDCTTITPGVFAAGDGRTKRIRQLTTAAADGTIAALAAVDFAEAR